MERPVGRPRVYDPHVGPRTRKEAVYKWFVEDPRSETKSGAPEPSLVLDVSTVGATLPSDT